MTKPVVLFGASDTAELAWLCLTHDAGRQVDGFTVGAEYALESTFRGLPLVPFEDVQQHFPPSHYDMLVAVGNTDINRLRARTCREAVEKGYTLISYVSSRATTFPGFSIGPNCFVGAGCTIQPFACLGANVTLVGNVHVGHHATIEDDCFIAAGVAIAGRVTVGQGTFIGINATVRDRIRIGRNCVIGAGGLLLKDTPDYTVYVERGSRPSTVPSDRLLRL